MLRKEVWTTSLAANLIRTTASAAAALHTALPHETSFTANCQFGLATWMLRGRDQLSSQRCEHKALRRLKQISLCCVANRLGRIEPRVIERRQNQYDLMKEPRAMLRARLLEMQQQFLHTINDADSAIRC